MAAVKTVKTGTTRTLTSGLTSSSPGAAGEKLGGKPKLGQVAKDTAATTTNSLSQADLSISRKLDIKLQGQGNTNACGTTSVAMILSYWGKKTDYQTVDKGIRRENDMFSPTLRLGGYAISQGMRAGLKSDASLEDLAKMVDQGVPPIVLIDPLDPKKPDKTAINTKDAKLHYVVVSGYERDKDGKISKITVSDPQGKNGTRFTVSAKKFEEAWSDLKLNGKKVGINRLMLSSVPDGDTIVTGADGKKRKAADIELPKGISSNTKVALYLADLALAFVNLGNNVKENISKLY